MLMGIGKGSDHSLCTLSVHDDFVLNINICKYVHSIPDDLHLVSPINNALEAHSH